MICDRHARLSYWLFVSFLRQKGGFAEVIFSTDRNEQLKAVARDALMTERILKEQGGESGRSVSARLKQLGVNLDGLLASSLMASFSDVFPPHCLERIWDIILGGSRDILAYISAAFLISLRRRLDELETADDVFREMESGELVKGIDTDAVTQTGIGIWERNQAQYSVFRSGGSNVSPSGAGGAGAGGAR